jgi:uncharacterized Tic20 family protein
MHEHGRTPGSGPSGSWPPPVQDPGQRARSQERTWAMFCHLAALCTFLGVPFGFVVGPLVVWLIKRDESPFINRHGKAALNFQISLAVYFICLVIVLIGLVVAASPRLFLTAFTAVLVFQLTFVLTSVFDLAFVIVAAIRANKGFEYRYPFAIPFLR